MLNELLFSTKEILLYLVSARGHESSTFYSSGSIAHLELNSLEWLQSYVVGRFPASAMKTG